MDKKEHIYSRDNNKIAHNESFQRMRDKRFLILAMALPRTADLKRYSKRNNLGQRKRENK